MTAAIDLRVTSDAASSIGFANYIMQGWFSGAWAPCQSWQSMLMRNYFPLSSQNISGVPSGSESTFCFTLSMKQLFQHLALQNIQGGWSNVSCAQDYSFQLYLYGSACARDANCWQKLYMYLLSNGRSPGDWVWASPLAVGQGLWEELTQPKPKSKPHISLIT